ncbi:hypothetical protein I5907_19090 [Panacibacter sp. DH6]|uniref:Uncharacterized protein n=1 Tax=Panacibacter microcysteis TaxID=2793269 RepID=A0A931MD20_9BACT|nr:hypothetical protein [Panacibacter microcysteis]MBG9378352.1 hypothetical protein [Panacibacter microcysteis]
MKKTISGLCLAFLTVLFISTGCKKDAAGPDCTAMAKEVSDASMAYVNDDSPANCERLKNAYIDYLGSSCIPDAQKEQTQMLLDQMELLCP